MQLFKHLTANNIKLVPYNFLRELSMEAYLIENRNVLILDNDNFSDIEIIDVELSLKSGRKTKKTDGRIDILAIYDQLTLAIIELKLGELNQLHLEQLEDYLTERNQILDKYREQLEIENNEEVKWRGILVGSSIDSNLENGTYEANGKFGISKKQMTRGEVLEKLQNYFNGVGVKDGYVSVGSITFVHTTFEICNGHPS